MKKDNLYILLYNSVNKNQYFAINSLICTLTKVVISWRSIFSISINPLFIFCTYNRFCHGILKAGDKATSVSGYDEYISDPAKPVPYISDNYIMKSKPIRHYKEYIEDDQNELYGAKTDVNSDVNSDIVYDSSTNVSPTKQLQQSPKQLLTFDEFKVTYSSFLLICNHN